MKQAKTLSLILAMVLAFVFISSPAVVFSAGGDEHPWDEEYIASEEGDNTNGTSGASDTTVFMELSEMVTITGDGDDEWEPFFDWFWNYSGCMMYLQYLSIFEGLPPAGQSSNNEDGVQDGRSLIE